MSILGSIPVMIVMAIVICIPLFIGAYVWQDAKRRGMHPLLWALVAAFAPGLIGLIIYLLVRGKYQDLECPRCGASIKEDFMVCPNCGTKLKPACPSCGAPVESGWKVCPICAKPLPEMQTDVQSPQKRKDKFLKVVLAIVILVPLLLIGIMVLGFSVAGSIGDRTGGVAALPMDYYLEIQEPETRQQVEQWYEGITPEQGHGYIIYREDIAQKGYEFLVYVPGAGRQVYTNFGNVLEMQLEKTGEDGNVFVIFHSGTELPKFKILLDGENIPVDLQKADFPIAIKG